MFDHIARLAKSPSMLPVAGRLIQYASQLAMLVLVPGALVPEAYLQISLVLPLANLGVSLIFGWLMGAIHRYVYELLDPNHPEAQQLTFLYFGYGSLLLCLVFAGASAVTDSSYRLVPIVLLSMALKNSVLQILNSSSRFRQFLLANILFAASLGVFISLCIFGYDKNVGHYLAIYAVLDALVATVFWYRVGVFRLRPTPRLDFAVARRYMKYGLPLILNSMAIWVISLSDRYLLTLWENTESVASYILSYQLGGNIIMLPLSLIVTVIFPKILLLDKDAGQEHALDWTYTILGYYTKLMPVFFILAAAIVLPFLYYAYPAYDFNPATTLIIILAHIIYGLSHFFNKEFELNGKTAQITRAVAAGAALNVGMNIALIPLIGIIGAAISTLLAYSLTILILYRSRQHVPQHP